jgi:hypothetical protein
VRKSKFPEIAFDCIEFRHIFRDLAQHLRTQLEKVLGGTNIVSVKDDKLDKQFKSLEVIANDVYHKKYPRKYQSTSTGLTPEQCSQVLSSEFLEYSNEEKKS